MRFELEDPAKKKQEEERAVFSPPKDEKRTLKTEIAKIKSLGAKDGWAYFWEYYHIPVIVIILVIAFSVSMAVSIIRNSRPYVISVYVYNNALSEDANVEALEQEFTESQGMNLKDYQIGFNLSEYFDPASQDEASYTSMMKIAAQVSAGDIDILGGNQTFMNYYGMTDEDNCFFVDLEEILPAQFLLFLKEQGRLLTLKKYNEDGTVAGEYVAGVEISNTRLVNSEALMVTPCYVGIVTTAKRADTAVNFLKWLFSYQG